MDPFDVLSQVQSDYLTYVRTFQRFQSPSIREWVLEREQIGGFGVLRRNTRGPRLPPSLASACDWSTGPLVLYFP